ncbi:NADAR family protein [Rufibacter ruber]|uniref:NADAR family protein n=1 Tax=Rufibacter ruber TaxID=1783499 RepID=UPI000AB4F57D|nr:NADAR family protein [Rufibacter ruber]
MALKEHYFQTLKFGDAAYQEKIRIAAFPRMARELGKTRQIHIRTDWEEVRKEGMLSAVRKKLQTHTVLMELLLSAPLAEASPYDFFWGIGADGTGQNRLGHLLMQVREELHV